MCKIELVNHLEKTFRKRPWCFKGSNKIMFVHFSAPDYSPRLQNITYNKVAGIFEITISSYPNDKEVYNDLERPSFVIYFQSPTDEQGSRFDFTPEEVEVTAETDYSLEYTDVGFVVYNISIAATNQYGESPSEDYCYLSPQAGK